MEIILHLRVAFCLCFSKDTSENVFDVRENEYTDET